LGFYFHEDAKGHRREPNPWGGREGELKPEWLGDCKG